MRALCIGLALTLALAGCGAGQDDETPPASEPATTSSPAPESTVAGPPLPTRAPLPVSLELDPCSLLGVDDLASMGVETARVMRSGGADAVVDGGGIQPFVSCNWYSTGGMPLVWIKVQEAEGVSPPSDTGDRVAVGDGAWTESNLGAGRDELYVIAGERLLRVTSQALALPGSSEERSAAAARLALEGLTAPDPSAVAGVDPSRWGGPAVDLCSVLSDNEAGEAVGRGDTFWVLPTVDIPTAPGADTGDGMREGVGCIWQSSSGELRRFIVTFLGPDGVAASESLYRAPEDLAVAGRTGRWQAGANPRLMIPLDGGSALELARQNLRGPSDEEFRALMERLGARILAALGID